MKEQTQNIALRLAAFSAAIPIVWLCKELSPRPLDGLLTLTLYAASNFAISYMKLLPYSDIFPARQQIKAALK